MAPARLPVRLWASLSVSMPEWASALALASRLARD